MKSWLLAGAFAIAAGGLPRTAHAAVLAPSAPAGLQSGTTVSVAPARVVEGDAGTSRLVFHLQLATTGALPYHVLYRTEDGSALADSDYVPQGGVVLLQGDGAEDSVVVDVLGDTQLEPNEFLRLHVLSADGAALADSFVAGWILNDERTHFSLVSGNEFPPYWSGSLSPAFADVDDDGDLDLPLYECFSYDGYRERDGFRAMLEGGNYHGSAWCDYDKNGYPDLVILPYEQEVGDTTRGKFLHNDRGTLTDIAPALGLDFFGNGETAVWGDFDGDDWPDLFTPYYAWRTPYRSFLWFNQRDGTFREDAVAAGVAMADQPPELDPEGAQAVDWNDDGALDLYVGSHLFQNDGTGHFTDVRAQVGLPETFDEGAEWVDYDDDGRFDLYLRTPDGPRLFRNDGASFHEVTTEVGLPALPLAWGDRWVDVDNDGDMDLFLTTSQTGSVRLYLNRGDGTFEPDTAFDALGVKGVTTVTGDVDADGDVDVVTVFDAPVLLVNHLEQVPGERSSYLRVRVLDRTGHETEFGATVRVRFPGQPERGVLTRAVDGGSAYLTQSEYTLNFGGVGPDPLAVEVSCPSPAGQRIVVDERVNPVLGALAPGASPERTIDVYEDGRVAFEIGPVAGIGPGGAHADGAAARIALVAPSPARSTARFTVAARAAGRAGLALYDVAGRRVRALGEAAVGAGASATFAWDLRDEAARRVPAGVYFARLSWNGAPLSARRLVVAR